MGIYGLISANGLSEYLTGKDVLGNELTDEQRHASLSQGIFAGLPFAPHLPGMMQKADRLSQEAVNRTVQLGSRVWILLGHGLMMLHTILIHIID